MKKRRRFLSVVAVACIGAAVAIGVADAREPDGEVPSLEAALHVDGRCGLYADELPPLVIRSGVAPGETVADVTICLRSRGPGTDESFTLAAIELVDVETGCTGDEALFDASCGADGLGELSSSLILRVGAGRCRSEPQFDPKWDGRLSDLAAQPVILTEDFDNGRLCVRLGLHYTGSSDGGESSQSDQTSWRYEFTLLSTDTAD